MTGKESIFIIGGLGYPDQASRDRTLVHQLDLREFSIRQVETCGAGPDGGTHGHKAQLVDQHEQAAIRITKTVTPEDVTNKDEKGVATKEESRVFMLRIHDMKWI